MTTSDHDEADEVVAEPTNEVETLLRRVLDLVETARLMPLSANVMINREELLELVEETLERLPEELRAARWLLREREEFLRKVQREGDEILEEARLRAEQMVQRSEVVRAAEHAARRTVEEAEAEARKLRHEAEDFCDQRLAQFEAILDRTTKTVQAGRERFASPPVPATSTEEESAPSADMGFFDQDNA